MKQHTEILNDFDTSIGKIEDAGAVVKGGAIDRYWFREGLNMEVQQYFDELPKHDWLFDSNLALKHFDLRSIEFGNWMSQQDRATFLYCSMLSLHHLALLFDISDAQIGMKGKLSIALGARGKGKASGHYEPNPYAVINITKTKGFGVLAHEYAHALDNIISFYTGQKKQTYVSGGRTTRKGYDTNIAKNGNWFEKQFEEFFNKLYFNGKGEVTDFNKSLNALEDYWHRRTEVLARTFEVYTHYKLSKKGIINTFLVEKRYNYKAYPKEKLMLEVLPMLDKIIKRAFNLLKRAKPLNGVIEFTGYDGFRKTLKQSANVDDTLTNMQRIAYRDKYQVKDLANHLKGKNVKETAENIWNYLRANTRYKLDQNGIEELRTPARSLIDGKVGITDNSFGIDCDDYSILISALLLNLNIKHEFRVTAYTEKGKFQHIYPVAYDSLGNSYVIDVVPEIPHFNYEAKPIIDLKKIPMELHELSGIEDDVTQNEIKNDLLEDLNQPFELSEIDDFEQQDELLESEFLSGFGQVTSREQADIVLHGIEDTIALIENGLFAEINKAKTSLIKEQNNPTILSQVINVAKEISLINKIMRFWNDDLAREKALKNAITSGSSYANFYKAMLLSLNKLEHQDLAGTQEELYETPIYLAKVDMEAFKLENLLDEENLEGFGDLGRRRRGFFRRLFRGIGKGLKKVVKAVVRFNPATILIRAAIRLVLKINLFKIASRLIYGYLTEAQALEQGLELKEWRKLVKAKKRAERFYTKIGGRASKFKRAIVRGKAAKKTGLQLGVVATGTTAAASGFILFVRKLLKAINPAKLFKKIINKVKNKRGGNSENTTVDTQTTQIDNTDYSAFQKNSFSKDEQDEQGEQKKGFVNKVKAFFGKHKKKIYVTSVSGILIIIAVIFYNKNKKKKKRSLAGIKAAKTRARNRRLATTKRTPRRKRTPQLKGSTTILKIPTKSVTRAKISRRSNGNRLKLMHKKAKELRKKYPKTKYSTLLKKASKLI